MSKPTNSRTKTKTIVGVKAREASKERNTILKSQENVVATTKAKPGIKAKETGGAKPKIKIETPSSRIAVKKKSTVPETPSSKIVAKNKSTSKISLTKKSTVPETPPSSKRMSKTQYFPNKSLYGKVVKEQIKLEDERSKTRTLTHKDVEEPERPRTATLKRGSIVNSNVAGPNIPVSETPSLTSLDSSSFEQEPKAEANKYEDDFDSYESDFEEYCSSDSQTSLSSSPSYANAIIDTSSCSDDNEPKPNTSALTDEERMLDSGNFDLPENKHKQVLNNITESEVEKKEFVVETGRSNMGSLSDEGYEEGKSFQSGNVQFINFLEAQKKWKQNRSLEKRKKRGEEILNMIRLDYYNFTLFEMHPVSYEDFIKSFGKTNTIQVYVQTGEEDVCEEIQTDPVDSTNKWTQFPVSFSKIDSSLQEDYLENYRREFAGVGADPPTPLKLTKINQQKLLTFLKKASRIILALLEESFCQISENIRPNSREIPFSSGHISFDTKTCPLLQNRPVTFVSYIPTGNIKILTVHGRNKESRANTKSAVCVWNLLETARPEKILLVTGELTFCIFISEMKSFIFGGLADGSITIWALENTDQIEILNDSSDGKERFQEPTYMTDIECGHSARIISIQPLINGTENSSFEWKSPKDEICSMDENGILIVWSVIVRNDRNYLAWDRVHSLVLNIKFDLRNLNPVLKDLACTDMRINTLDPHHLYISTNYGFVLHCLTSGTKANPKKYYSGSQSQANCLESCPFSPAYFFAGHADGTIALYSRLLEKPLMIVANKEESVQNGVELLQWSHDRPCVFYAKDSHDTIHVWDLAISDIFPVHSIPFEQKITCMKLARGGGKNDGSFMILAGKDGMVHLHVLNDEYGPKKLEERRQRDVRKFVNYVNRL